jgi:hypothetical protein
MTAVGIQSSRADSAAYWECLDGCGAGESQANPHNMAIAHTLKRGHNTQVMTITRIGYGPGELSDAIVHKED